MAKQSKGPTKSNKPLKASSKVQVMQKKTEMHSMMSKFYWDQLRDMYYIEKIQIKALGRMAKKATTEELKDIFLEHQETTQEQLNRLDEVFDLIGKKAQTRKCAAFDGLIEEMDEMVRETEDDTLTRDVAVIISSQKIDHYEIACYGSLTTLARTYGMIEVADLLQESLDEEKENDLQLTYIAENSVNYEAGLEDKWD